MVSWRRGRGTTWALATALVGTLLAAAPGAGAAPLPRLTRDVRVEVSGMRAVDVYLPRAVRVPYRDWFDAPRSRFENTVPGAGLALVSLDRAYYGPTLVAHTVHYRTGGRNVVMLFGDDGRGNDILETETLPPGRYRLYAWAPRATRLVLHLDGLSSGNSVLRPARSFTGHVDRLDAPLAVTPTGVALGNTRTMAGSQFMVLTATAERLNPSATGYYHGRCLYDGAPPGGVFAHFCPGGGGVWTGVGVPALDVEQLNAGAVVAVPGGTRSVSTWILGSGAIKDQTATLVWLPLPLPLRATPAVQAPAATDGARGAAEIPAPAR